MPSIQFYLLGEEPATGHEIEVNSDNASDYESLRHLVAGHFAILEPNGKENTLNVVAVADQFRYRFLNRWKHPH